MTASLPAGTSTAPDADDVLDRLPAVVEVDLDSFTIGEMDALARLKRETPGVGDLTCYVWLTLRRQGVEVSLEDVANIPAGRMRMVRGEESPAVPLRTA